MRVTRAQKCSALRFSHKVMPFERHGTEPLDAVVNVRVTAAEKARLTEDAAAAGLTLSALSRRRMLGRRVVANVDEVMIRELRRLGGLLKLVHVESGGAYSERTDDALRAVKAAIETLGGGDRDR
jgi:hypothetical protein